MMFAGINGRPWWMDNGRLQGDAIGVDLGAEAVTSKKAMEAAGLDFSVVKKRSAWLDDRMLNVDGWSTWQEAEGERFLVRQETGTILGRCTVGYEEFQNHEAFEFLDSLVGGGDLLYHTAGSLEGGKRVWIMAQTPASFVVRRPNGREVDHHAFLLCVLGHDGKSGIRLMGTDVTAVCANTVGWADSTAERENLVFNVSHRGDIKAKLALAAKAIEQMADETPARRELLQAMAQTAMDTEEMIDFATGLFLCPNGDPDEVAKAVADFYAKATPRSKTILENKVGKLVACAKDGIVQAGDEGSTVYDMMEGVTQFFDHFDLDHVATGSRRTFGPLGP